jgi:hypothetical protein
VKDYLGKNERVQLLFLKKYIDNIETMLIDKNITKLEHKNLKTAMTFGLKGFNEKIDRLNPSALKTFHNSMKESYLSIEDRYAIQGYNRKLSSQMDDAYELNRDYYKLVELIMDANCCGCNKCGAECEIYKEFELKCIPEPSGELERCRYAYRRDDKC